VGQGGQVWVRSQPILSELNVSAVVNGYRNYYVADAKNSFYNELATRLELSPKTLQSLVDGEITYANVVSMY
jgi:hypothetical protein